MRTQKNTSKEALSEEGLGLQGRFLFDAPRLLFLSPAILVAFRSLTTRMGGQGPSALASASSKEQEPSAGSTRGFSRIQLNWGLYEQFLLIDINPTEGKSSPADVLSSGDRGMQWVATRRRVVSSLCQCT